MLGYWDVSATPCARGRGAPRRACCPLFKETVEDLFARGLVKVVFATETLALGINMPARSVVLEKLVKWDGSSHVDVTPGEYTQLTGRAGRRGIDTEGHAVVVRPPRPGPGAAGGAGVQAAVPAALELPADLQHGGQPGRAGGPGAGARGAGDVLRAVPGRPGRGRPRAAGTGARRGPGRVRPARWCATRATSREYAELRRQITAREKDLTARPSVRSPGRGRAARSKACGPVTSWRSRSVDGPVTSSCSTRAAPPGSTVRSRTVLTVDRPGAQARRSPTSGPAVTAPSAFLRVPKGFTRAGAGRTSRPRRRAAVVRSAPAPGHPQGPAEGRPRVAAQPTTPRSPRLRRRLRAHPCHSCPDREEHARWAERWARLAGEHDALVARIEGRTGSIAAVFDRICDVLLRLGLPGPPRRTTPAAPTLQVTDGRAVAAPAVRGERPAARGVPAPRRLRRARRAGAGRRGLDPRVPLARDDQGEPRVPGGPGSRLGVALDARVRAWSELDDLETRAQGRRSSRSTPGWSRPCTAGPPGAASTPSSRAASSSAGDFVRWCKQVIDVLDQIAQAAPHQRLRAPPGRRSTRLRPRGGRVLVGLGCPPFTRHASGSGRFVGLTSLSWPL